ncbi:unnamed protein product [Cuscuta campestris]|uniref:Uncharacterized protein n=1 Tax=Cuscuta campestris TaxID=132261 RepID=A0A484LWC9_9ASTE|nr:unnamed protein product [Cuscuta campestris]
MGSLRSPRGRLLNGSEPFLGFRVTVGMISTKNNHGLLLRLRPRSDKTAAGRHFSPPATLVSSLVCSPLPDPFFLTLQVSSPSAIMIVSDSDSASPSSHSRQADHSALGQDQGQSSFPQSSSAAVPGQKLRRLRKQFPSSTPVLKGKRVELEENIKALGHCQVNDRGFADATDMVGPSIEVQRPTRTQTALDAPPGFFTIHLASLKKGLRFPLHSLLIQFLNEVDLLPCQLVPNSHRYNTGYLIECKEAGVEPTLNHILFTFKLAKGHGDWASYASLSQRSSKLFTSDKKGSTKDWKPFFVFVSTGPESPFTGSWHPSILRVPSSKTNATLLSLTLKHCGQGAVEIKTMVTEESLAKLGFEFVKDEHRHQPDMLRDLPERRCSPWRPWLPSQLTAVATERMGKLVVEWLKTGPGAKWMVGEAEKSFNCGLFRAQQVIRDQLAWLPKGISLPDLGFPPPAVPLPSLTLVLTWMRKNPYTDDYQVKIGSDYYPYHEEPPYDTPSRNFGYQDTNGDNYYTHGDQDDYDQYGPMYEDQSDPLVEEIIRLEQKIFYFDEVLFAEGSWYEPPYCRDYTLFAEEQIEVNKVAIRERAKLLESVRKEREFGRRLCEGSEMMQKMLDGFQRERLEVDAKADKLVNDLCKAVELKRSLQSQDQMREINVQKEALEPKTNPEPINHQVPVLEDSPSSTPSHKLESITTLARATVVILPECPPSQVPSSIVVHEVEPTEGPDLEPPTLIQEKEEEVFPIAINDHLLNCVEDTPLEEPVLEEIEPITCPQDTNVQESEEESIDEEIPSTEEPITSIDNHASSEDLDQTFFDSLLDGCDFVCPKDSWSQKSWDEFLVSDTEDSSMGESMVVIIKPQMDSQPIEDKEEINLAIKANDVDRLRRLPPPPINTKSPSYILLPPSHRDESRILDLDRAKIQTRWENRMEYLVEEAKKRFCTWGKHKGFIALDYS